MNPAKSIYIRARLWLHRCVRKETVMPVAFVVLGCGGTGRFRWRA